MKPGMPIAIVLFVGALLIGIGSATKSWFGMNEHDMSAHAGLFSFEFCEEDHCESQSYLKDLKHAHGRQLVATFAGLGATLCASAVSILGILGGIFLLGGKKKRVVSLLTTIGAGIALFLAVVFMISMDAKGLSIGFGVFLYFIGGIGLLVAGILSMKGAPAGMPMAMQSGGMPPQQYGGMPPQQYGGMPMQSGGMPPMQQPYQGAPNAMQSGGMPPMQQMQPGSPPCPTCRNALQFVPQYTRWFCAACNRYV